MAKITRPGTVRSGFFVCLIHGSNANNERTIFMNVPDNVPDTKARLNPPVFYTASGLVILL
ncbi:MAG: hypothetical protein RI556_12910, partial [Hydrogenovibrio sp.]|uniref:hypothetical protein n=1 Tax=Hydrogenovibrio sp. TaxID=2065821 RepID=UPI0028703796